MIDRTCHQLRLPIRTKCHVLRTLSLRQYRQALFRITQRHQQRLAVLITIAVQRTRIIRLIRIFHHRVPTLHLQLRTHATRTYPLGQVVIVVVLTLWLDHGIEDDRILFLILTHITSANGQVRTRFLQLGYPFLQTQLQVSTHHGILPIVPTPCLVVIAVPIAALLTAQ